MTHLVGRQWPLRLPTTTKAGKQRLCASGAERHCFPFLAEMRVFVRSRRWLSGPELSVGFDKKRFRCVKVDFFFSPIRVIVGSVLFLIIQFLSDSSLRVLSVNDMEIAFFCGYLFDVGELTYHSSFCVVM